MLALPQPHSLPFSLHPRPAAPPPPSTHPPLFSPLLSPLPSPPFQTTQQEVPPSWEYGLQCTLNRHSAWWGSNAVKNWLDLRYSAMLPDVVAAREALEGEIMATTLAAEKAALALEDGTAAGYEAARQSLQAFAVGSAEVATRRWWGLADHLMAKYSNGCGLGGCPRTGLGPRGCGLQWTRRP